MEFEVDEAAYLKIKELRPSQEHGIRIAVYGGGCSGLSYSMEWLEAPKDGDQIIIHKDALVFIDKKSSLFLTGAMLQYEESLTSAGFKITSAKMKNVCGCGESFGV